jgi:hypothetical protein
MACYRDSVTFFFTCTPRQYACSFLILLFICVQICLGPFASNNCEHQIRQTKESEKKKIISPYKIEHVQSLLSEQLSTPADIRSDPSN